MNILYNSKTLDIVYFDNNANWNRYIPTDVLNIGFKDDEVCDLYVKDSYDFLNKDYSIILSEKNKLPIGFKNKNNDIIYIDEYNNIEKRDIENIFWIGPGLDAGSYAHINRCFVKGLKEKGVNIKFVIQQFNQKQLSNNSLEYFNDIIVSSSEFLASTDNSLAIMCYLPLPRFLRCKYNICYTMMETHTLKDNFVRSINSYSSEVWTPSSHNRDMFLDSGVTKDCYSMPLGVDIVDNSKIKDYDPKFEVINNWYEQKFDNNPKGFIFGSVFRWSPRKGPDVLLKSFVRSFKKGDDVSLVIYSRHPMYVQNESTLDCIRNEIKRVLVGEDMSNAAPIYWCHDIIPEDSILSIYHKMDAYISTSRGEGWNLPCIEAGVAKVPVICPNHTGHEYASSDCVWPIETDELVVCNDHNIWYDESGKIPIWITRWFSGQKFPLYGNKVIEQVSSYMKSIYGGVGVEEKLNNFYRKIIGNYTWEVVVDRVIKRINSIKST